MNTKRNLLCIGAIFVVTSISLNAFGLNRELNTSFEKIDQTKKIDYFPSKTYKNAWVANAAYASLGVEFLLKNGQRLPFSKILVECDKEKNCIKITHTTYTGEKGTSIYQIISSKKEVIGNEIDYSYECEDNTIVCRTVSNKADCTFVVSEGVFYFFEGGN